MRRGLLGLAVPICLRAQGTLASPRASSPAEAPTLRPYQTAADTGRMAWGDQDFRTYTTPPPCDQAIVNVTRHVWRVDGPDTLPYVPSADTLPTAAVVAARACLQQQPTIAQVAPRHLWSLLRVAFAARQDSQAAAVVRRAVQLAPTPAARARVLATAIDVAINVGRYMGAHPPRVEMAHAWLRQLDTLSPANRIAQFHGHVALLKYWRRLYAADRIRQEAATMLALVEHMSAAERDSVGVELLSPYAALLDLAADAGDLAQGHATLDSGKRLLGDWHGDYGGTGSDWFQYLGQRLQTQTTLRGQRLPPLQGDDWFNAGQTTHPDPGTVSLIVYAPESRDFVAIAAMLKEVHARYGSLVDMTLVSETEDNLWFHRGTPPLTPHEEAQELAHFYLDVLKLPAALLVDETPITKRPDGRLVREPTPISDMAGGWRGCNLMLVDRDGRIQWLGNWDAAGYTPVVEAAIDRVMGAPRTAPPSGH